MVSANTAEKVADKVTGQPGSAEDVVKQINDIRAEIAQLNKLVGNIGSNAADTIKAQAKEKLSQLSDLTEEELKLLRAKADLAGEKLVSGVRKQPLAAVGIAAGVGFVLALMLRK
jgi:ElaB/YqjD/DUF883 family membrane-anchored ribosome-binding protein